MRSRSMRRIILAGAAALLSASMLTGAQAAPVERAQVGVSFSTAGVAQTLSATGVAELPIVRSPGPPTFLSMSVSQRSAGLDRETAVRMVIEKVAAVRSALEKMGVPPGNIVIANATVFPVYGNPLPSNAVSPQEYTVSENLRVFGVGTDKVDAAIQAALVAGATNAEQSLGAPARPAQPDTSAINQAVKQAADQAKTMAQAGAQGLGVTLGSIRNVQVQLPSFPVAAPGVAQGRVSVTVTYDIRQP